MYSVDTIIYENDKCEIIYANRERIVIEISDINCNLTNLLNKFKLYCIEHSKKTKIFYTYYYNNTVINSIATFWAIPTIKELQHEDY